MERIDQLLHVKNINEDKEVVITIKNMPVKKLYQLYSIFNSGKAIKGWIMTSISGFSMSREWYNTPVRTTINITAVKHD